MEQEGVIEGTKRPQPGVYGASVGWKKKGTEATAGGYSRVRTAR